MKRSSTPLERLLNYVVVAPSGCWIWAGARNDEGYGYIRIDGVLWKAHRLSFQLHVGQVPDGLELDHKCRVRECVNFRHLEAVTRAENMRRALRARPARCKHLGIWHVWQFRSKRDLAARKKTLRCVECNDWCAESNCLVFRGEA